MVRLMSHAIAIIKWLKNVFSLVFGFVLIIFSILSYIKAKGGFTPSDPPGFLINHIRYYDERVLVFLIIAGGSLIFYGLYGFYSDYYDRIGKH
jgi:hypothetical protein